MKELRRGKKLQQLSEKTTTRVPGGTEGGIYKLINSKILIDNKLRDALATVEYIICYCEALSGKRQKMYGEINSYLIQ